MPVLPPALLVAAYLIGSIPFSYFIAKLTAGEDLRRAGSGNVGATNVLRTAGRGAGVLALLLDLAKGYAVVALAQWVVMFPGWPAGREIWQSRELWVMLAALVAVLGHMFPVWLRFQGGKGVATGAGAFLALDPRIVAAAAIIFAIVLLLSRYVSLASMVTAATVPLLFRYMEEGPPFWRVVVSIAIALAVILKHHSNIARLAGGTERRLGQKRDER